MGTFLHLNEPDFAPGATVENANVAPRSARQVDVKALDERIARLLEKEFPPVEQNGQPAAAEPAAEH